MSFVKGAVIGFFVMFGVLVFIQSVHAEKVPAPPSGAAIQTKPPMREMTVPPMTYKCVQMGATPCGK